MHNWLLGRYIERQLDRMGGKKAGRHKAWLAEESDISPTYINYLIHGEASGRKSPPSPTIDVFLSLSKALGVPYTRLVTAYLGKDPDLEDTSEADSRVYKEAIQDFVRKLPLEEKYAILDQLSPLELEQAANRRFGIGKIVRKTDD